MSDLALSDAEGRQLQADGLFFFGVLALVPNCGGTGDQAGAHRRRAVDSGLDQAWRRPSGGPGRLKPAPTRDTASANAWRST
jgi:hypothetical protein